MKNLREWFDGFCGSPLTQRIKKTCENVALNVPESEKKDKRFHTNSIEKSKIEDLFLKLLLKLPAKTEENSENP
jgi:hypothetical protein